MPEFRLSEAAAAKLRVILRESELKFGRHQTGLYHAGFVKTFELLSLFPGIALRVDHLRSGYRRYRFESPHHLFHRRKRPHRHTRSFPRGSKYRQRHASIDERGKLSNLAAHTLQEE